MLSQIGICNAALSKLGDSYIISLADGSKQSRALNEAFPRVRDALLRAHMWHFSLTRAQLAALSTAPAFQYSQQYLLPDDLLRLCFVGDFYVGLDLADYRNMPGSEYKIEGRNLLTSLWGQSSTAALNIRYVKRVTDTTLYDPLFDELLACKLAAELATSLTQSDTLKKTALDEFRAVLHTAVRTNAIELPPESLADNTWLLSRL